MAKPVTITGKPDVPCVLVLWTTRYLEVALDRLDRSGQSIDTKDVERLSPLKSEM